MKRIRGGGTGGLTSISDLQRIRCGGTGGGLDLYIGLGEDGGGDDLEFAIKTDGHEGGQGIGRYEGEPETQEHQVHIQGEPVASVRNGPREQETPRYGSERTEQARERHAYAINAAHLVTGHRVVDEQGDARHTG